MIKIRMKFKKENDLIYISHLDMMRLFQRAFRRANISVRYSEGFNPHPKFSFATALSIGVSSIGEYMDIELDEEIAIDEFVSRMKDELPNGIEIIQAAYTTEKDALMAIIDWSTYIIEIPLLGTIDKDEAEKEINRFIDREEIIIVRQKKQRRGKKKIKTTKEVNIRELIKDINILMFENEKMILKTTLRTGSRGNLKPSALVEAIKNYTDFEMEEDGVKIQRLELFLEKDGNLVLPL